MLYVGKTYRSAGRGSGCGISKSISSSPYTLPLTAGTSRAGGKGIDAEWFLPILPDIVHPPKRVLLDNFWRRVTSFALRLYPSLFVVASLKGHGLAFSVVLCDLGMRRAKVLGMALAYPAFSFRI